MTRNTLALGLVLAGAVATVGAQTSRPQLTLPPTPLEALASQPDAKTTWSKFVGRLDGGAASAIVTAVAIQSDTAPTKTMRGVRIDLRHEGGRPDCRLKHLEWSVMCDREPAAAFIEESRLEAFRAAVRRGSAEVHIGYGPGVTTFSSSTHGGGILICGYELYGQRLDDLAALLATASAELAKAPR